MTGRRRRCSPGRRGPEQGGEPGRQCTIWDWDVHRRPWTRTTTVPQWDRHPKVPPSSPHIPPSRPPTFTSWERSGVRTVFLPWGFPDRVPSSRDPGPDRISSLRVGPVTTGGPLWAVQTSVETTVLNPVPNRRSRPTSGPSDEVWADASLASRRRGVPLPGLGCTTVAGPTLWEWALSQDALLLLVEFGKLDSRFRPNVQVPVRGSSRIAILHR